MALLSLFQSGKFELASGRTSWFKIDCDALTDADWRPLADMIRLMVGPYSTVEGIPTGGLKLAEILQKYTSPSGPHLIVDDVLTTGKSMNQAMFQISERAIGAVVFARGPCPPWIKPLFQMPEYFWPEPRTR